MIAAAWLLLSAALMFGYGPVFCWLADRRTRRQNVAVPVAPAVGLSDVEWAELTALQNKARAEDDATPLYDRMVCEQMEKAEGWA